MAIPDKLPLKEYGYYIATNPVTLDDISNPSEIRGKTVILQGTGPSAPDIEGFPTDDPDSLTVVIQRTIAVYPQYADLWDVAFLNDPLSYEYFPGIPDHCKLLVSWHFLTRKPEHENPEKLQPYRDRTYLLPMTLRQQLIGTGPTALLWALRRQETERVLLCGFNPINDPGQIRKRYKTQLAGWRALGNLDLPVPVYVSKNTMIPNVDWPVYDHS